MTFVPKVLENLKISCYFLCRNNQCEPLLDLSPQISKMVGALRHLTRLTSMCLLPVTLGFSKMSNPKILFLYHHGRFPLYLSSFPPDHQQRCCPQRTRGLTRKRCVLTQASPGSAESWGRLQPFKLLWAAAKTFCVVLCQEGDFLNTDLIHQDRMNLFSSH